MFYQQKEKVDAAEHFILAPLALLKILKHARAGIPLEVMGLILGEYINSYTIKVVDVFAMPQSGTGTTVEAIDPAFQAEMLELLEKTGRREYVIGWYHSHPGFGCWLSQMDCSTQQEFEKLNERCIAIVVDPVQSVSGNVVLEAFRSIPGMLGMANEVDMDQVSGNAAYLNKPSMSSIIHGLKRTYYSVRGEYSLDYLELKMLLNLEKKNWTEYLEIPILNSKVIEKKIYDNFKNFNSFLSNKIIECEKDRNLDLETEINKKNLGEINYKNRIERYLGNITTKSVLHKLLISIHREILSI